MKRANKILLLVTQADWGGVQSFLIRFAKQLMSEGREVLLAAGGEGELWAEAERAGIPTRRLKLMTREINPLKDWSAIGELKQLIREFKPDAIHLNSSKMGVLGSLASNDSRLTTYDSPPWTVYRIGGWAFLEPIPDWKRWLYRAAEKYSAKYKDVIITVHPGDEKIARNMHFVPRHGIVSVANGLDMLAFASRLRSRADARMTLGLPEHAFVFGTVANAYATKGLLPYLESFARIAKDNANVQGVIIGDGPELEMLKQRRRELGLENRITLTGHRDDAGTLYPAFDAFVLPSRKEGMPWTLLEAMAAGIPSIATDVGACKWMITDADHAHAGLLVPPNDPVSLIEAMRKLLNDTVMREALSRGGKSNVQQRFSWDATFRGNRDALDSILK